MCWTRLFHSKIELDSGDGPGFIDLCTCQTVVIEDERSQVTHRVTLGLEEGQLIVLLDFVRDQLLVVETQVSVRGDRTFEIEDNTANELLDEIRRDVPPYRSSGRVKRQIDAYVALLPRLYEACKSRPYDSTDMCDPAPVVQEVDRELEPQGT